MNGHILNGTTIAVDFWKIKGRHENSIHFLTHLHGDHIVGLTSSWQRPIYCSEFTSELLMKRYGLSGLLLRVCPLNQAILVQESNSRSFTVTAYNADHCPGAVMFYFEGDFGNILYTGDFRSSPKVIENCRRLINNIDTLYLDNTFCSPKCVFPPRDECFTIIVEIIRRHPKHDIVIGVRKLGKELLLAKIGEIFQETICVSPECYQISQLLFTTNVFTTVALNKGKSRIQAVPTHLISCRFVENLNQTRQTIAIIPSAIFTGLDCRPFSRDPNIYVVPYSDHCNFPELFEFVSALKPAKVHPIVRNFRGPFGINLSDREDMSCFLPVLSKERLAFKAQRCDSDGDSMRSSHHCRDHETSQLQCSPIGDLTERPNTVGEPRLTSLSPLETSRLDQFCHTQKKRKHSAFVPLRFKRVARGVVYMNPIPNDSEASVNPVVDNSETFVNPVVDSEASVNPVVDSEASVNSVVDSEASVNSVVDSEASVNSVVDSEASVNPVVDDSEAFVNPVVDSEASVNSVVDDSEAFVNPVVDSEASVNPVVDDSEAFVNPVVDSEASVNSVVDDSEAFVNPVVDSEASVNSVVDNSETFVNPVVDNSETFVNPVVDDSETFVNPVVDDRETFVNPVVGDSETFVNPVVDNSETFVNPVVDDSETFVNPVVGDSETCVNPVVGDSETCVNPVVGDSETCVNPVVGDSQACVNSVVDDKRKVSNSNRMSPVADDDIGLFVTPLSDHSGIHVSPASVSNGECRKSVSDTKPLHSSDTTSHTTQRYLRGKNSNQRNSIMPADKCKTGGKAQHSYNRDGTELSATCGSRVDSGFIDSCDSFGQSVDFTNYFSSKVNVKHLTDCSIDKVTFNGGSDHEVKEKEITGCSSGKLKVKCVAQLNNRGDTQINGKVSTVKGPPSKASRNMFRPIDLFTSSGILLMPQSRWNKPRNDHKNQRKDLISTLLKFVRKSS